MAERPFRRRGNMTLYGFVTQKFYWGAEEFWFVVLINVVILAVCSPIVFGLIQSDQNSHATSHQHIEQALFSDGDHANDLSADARQKRRDMASRISAVQGLDGFSINVVETGDLDRIKHIAETGESIKYDDTVATWGTDFFNGWWLHHLLPIGFVLILVFMFISYAGEASNDRERIADLPWRKPWAWGFVALTLVPFGWFAYPISLFRIRSDNKLRVKLEADRQREREEYEAREAERQARGETRRETPPEPPCEPEVSYTYVPAPKSARATYFDLRTGFTKLRKERRLIQLRDEEAEVKQTLKQYGDEIRDRQQKLGEIRVSIKNLEAEAPPDLDESNRERIESEFQRIIETPGVAAVRVVNDEVSVLVRPRYTYEGKRYHLGDWEIRFGDPERGNYLYTYCLEVGARKSWLDRHGWQYPLYGYRDRFCFGARATEISNHLSRGQYAEAVELAIECMQTINPEHQHDIPNAFLEVPT